MATIRDAYQLDTYANTTGLTQAEGAAKELAHGVGEVGRAATTASAKTRGLGSHLSGLGGIARGLAGTLKGLALSLGALGAGAILGIPRLLNSIKGAMAGATGAAGGVGKAAQSAAQSAEAAKKQVGGLMGAWGDVGAGYVMAAGKKAQDVASDAAEVADEVADSMDRSGEATSRFGQVLDRIGKRWGELKDIVLRALGRALLPLLEKFLELLEDPATQQFVELLAEDLADAVTVVADWMMNKAIPAIGEWIKKINDMGGPLEALKGWWNNLKTTVLQIIAIILAEILRLTSYITTSLETWKSNFRNLKTIIDTVVAGIKLAFGGLKATIKSVFEGIMVEIKNKINTILEYVNYVIGLYNEIAVKIGLPELPTFGLLQTGGVGAATTEGSYGARAATTGGVGTGFNIGTVVINASGVAEGRAAADAFTQYLRGAAAAGIRP